MIYNIQTVCTYGYWPDTDLKPKSHKPIIAACDGCGKVRVLRMGDYHDLCKSCVQLKRYEDPIERERTSKVQKKSYQDDPTRAKRQGESIHKAHQNDSAIAGKIGDSVRKAHVDDPTIGQQKSKSQKKRYGNMEDPGLEIAYDFARPEALTVEVTRRFHGSIHNPKGLQRHKRGYSLID